MVSNIRLAWLAGIIDGEGSISAQARKPRTVVSIKGKSYQSRGQLDTFISIANTNADLIAEARKIIEDMGVGVNVSYHASLRLRTLKQKPCWYISVHGFKRVGEVLSQVRPYLVSKKAQADLLLEMIRHRMKTQDTRKAFGPRSSFRDDAWLMEQLGQLQYLNKRGPDSEQVEVL